MNEINEDADEKSLSLVSLIIQLLMCSQQIKTIWSN